MLSSLLQHEKTTHRTSHNSDYRMTHLVEEFLVHFLGSESENGNEPR
jgi:hypothetical protein